MFTEKSALPSKEDGEWHMDGWRMEQDAIKFRCLAGRKASVH